MSSDPLRLKSRIVKAVGMLIQGKTAGEIAEALGVTVKTVHQYRYRYKRLWEAAFDEAMKGVVDPVRAQVGTDAVLADPDGYTARARAADKWTAARGEELFPKTGDGITLTEFYETYYEPLRLADAASSTRKLFRLVLRRWKLLTGDPPIASIHNFLLAKFRDALSRSRGIKPHLKMAPRTVRNMLAHIQTLLDMAGPPSRGHRDAVGLIPGPVPWIKPPRVTESIPRVIPWERIEAMYLATASMDRPRNPGIKPPAWWRAFLLTTLYTGLRRRTLIELRMDHIQWQARRLVIPAEHLKQKRPHVVPLHPVVIDHLRTIRTDRELVFPWGSTKRMFYWYFHQLQDRAGIPAKEYYGCHDLRRTLATALWPISPQAAQFMLGHTMAEVTRQFYVDPDSTCSQAVQALPVPDVFTLGRG